MISDESIVVDLPEGAGANECDRAILKAACEAVMALRYERSPECREILRGLAEEGWTVSWTLAWNVTLRRPGESEQASGTTLDEALRQAAQLARAEVATRWP